MQVLLTYEAWHRMRCYVNASYPPEEENRGVKTLREISGVGLVKQTDAGDLLVYDTLLMPHEATMARVDLTTTAAMNGWAEVVTEIAQNRPEVMPDLAVWWHSHPFGVKPAFSSIDTGTMERWELPDGYLLSIVTNEFGDLSIRYDQWTPIRQRLDLPYSVMLPELTQTGYQEIGIEDVRAEVKEKVTYPVVERFGGSSNGAWGRDALVWKNGEWSKPLVNLARDLNPAKKSLAPLAADAEHDVMRPQSGDWEVWRVDSRLPYKVTSRKKKKAAKEALNELSDLLGSWEPDVKYVIRHKDEPQPESQFKVPPLAPQVTSSGRGWAVFRKGHSQPITTSATEADAESERKKLQEYADEIGTGFVYSVVQELSVGSEG